MRRRKTTTQYPPLFLDIPLINSQELYVSPKQVETFEYYALSEGSKRVYTDEDALTGYGIQKILDPKTVSLINLFINGVLQPKNCYHVEIGKMTILTEDIPTEGIPIILQMVKIS